MYPIPGVITPMLYIGMLYASFAWHVEDHFMYSINYAHAGASKIWYCVPACGADDFENTAAETVYRTPYTTMKQEQGASAQACHQAVAKALAGKTTSMCPKYLVNKGIPVYRAVQEAGSYVITFPRSYHSGFSTGFNLGEAVNFVLSDWWPFGEHSRRLYKSLNRQQIISHEQVLCDDATAVAEKINTLNKIELDIEDRPVAIAFVAMMQQVHRLRETFQTKNIIQVANCSPDTPSDAAEMRASVPCERCSHHSYLVSAVVDARKPQYLWEHVCLECAAPLAEGDVDDGDVNAPSSHLMVYVKPLWSTMEDIFKVFTSVLAKQPVLEANGARSFGSGSNEAAAVVHQSLSLDGCCANAIENVETLNKYTWTELDEPVLYTPSWVAKQPQPTKTLSASADGNDGNESHQVSQLEEEKRPFRKRSCDEYDLRGSLLKKKGKNAPFPALPMASSIKIRLTSGSLKRAGAATKKKKEKEEGFVGGVASAPAHIVMKPTQLKETPDSAAKECTKPTKGDTTVLTPSTRLEDLNLPPLEADVLDLMETEFLRLDDTAEPAVVGAAAAPQQLPPPLLLPSVAAEQFVSHSQPQQVAP